MTIAGDGDRMEGAGPGTGPIDASFVEQFDAQTATLQALIEEVKLAEVDAAAGVRALKSWLRVAQTLVDVVLPQLERLLASRAQEATAAGDTDMVATLRAVSDGILPTLRTEFPALSGLADRLGSMLAVLERARGVV